MNITTGKINSEIDLIVLAYLSDEEIEIHGGANGALLEAYRRDEEAAKQLTLDALNVQGILLYVIPPCPEHLSFDSDWGKYESM